MVLEIAAAKPRTNAARRGEVTMRGRLRRESSEAAAAVPTETRVATREKHAVQPAGAQNGGALVVAGQTADVYIPKEGEMGLLEIMYHTRAAEGNEARVPVCSRPEYELQRNFSDYTGGRCDLHHRVLLRGKMGVMRDQLSGVDDEAVISGRDFKGLAGGLQDFCAPEYLLVSYKDYSVWAVKHYRRDVQGGGWLNPWGGPQYVKKHFAVEVGTGPAAFIKLSESQFLVGCNKLYLGRTEAGPAANGSADPLLQHLLSQEQLNTILNVRAPGQEHGAAHQDPHDTQPRPAGGGGGAHDPNQSLLDYLVSLTPLGWYRRARDDAYRAIGSAAVTLCIYAAVAFATYRYVLAPFVFPVLRIGGGGGDGSLLPEPQSRRGGYNSSRDSRRGGDGGGDMVSPFSFVTNRVSGVFDRILLGL